MKTHNSSISCAMLVIALFGNALAGQADAACPRDSSHAQAAAELLVHRVSSGIVPWEDCLLIAADGTVKGELQFLETEPGIPVEDRLDASQVRILLAQFDLAHDQEAAVNSGHSNFVFEVKRGARRLQWTGMTQPTNVDQLQKTLVELLVRLYGNGSSDK